MKQQLFYCYDMKLAKYLRYDKNIPFLTKAKHIDTDSIFHLFVIDNALQEALDEYKKR
jgi:hypothetical protein